MSMSITLSRENGAAHYVARNAEAITVSIDGAPAVGGEGRGFRPMELLLTAIASCATMDVGPILAKQRQTVNDIQVSATGERQAGTPSPFSTIHLTFALSGEIEVSKASRAVELAVTRYCSARASLDPAIEVTWAVTVNGAGAP